MLFPESVVSTVKLSPLSMLARRRRRNSRPAGMATASGFSGRSSAAGQMTWRTQALSSDAPKVPRRPFGREWGSLHKPTRGNEPAPRAPEGPEMAGQLNPITGRRRRRASLAARVGRCSRDRHPPNG